MGLTGDVLRFIRVEHSVFALPFVYIGLLLAPGALTLELVLLTTLAAVGARGTAMGLNRVIDRVIDGKNPRTARREMPAGRIGLPTAWALIAGFLALYLFATWNLNALVFHLAWAPIIPFVVYPYLKRFTWTCHLFLGFTLGFAPMGGWLAKTGTFTDVTVPFLLAFGVMFWVAGFDIIYAMLDVGFDRNHGLHSVPADFGTRAATAFSGGLHVLTIIMFVAAGLIADLGLWYWLGLVGVAALLVHQHRIVRPDDPRSINKAAFQINGYTGFVLLAGVLLAVLTGGTA